MFVTPLTRDQLQRMETYNIGDIVSIFGYRWKIVDKPGEGFVTLEIKRYYWYNKLFDKIFGGRWNL
jgi:hypothetical protein